MIGKINLTGLHAFSCARTLPEDFESVGESMAGFGLRECGSLCYFCFWCQLSEFRISSSSSLEVSLGTQTELLCSSVREIPRLSCRAPVDLWTDEYFWGDSLCCAGNVIHDGPGQFSLFGALLCAKVLKGALCRARDAAAACLELFGKCVCQSTSHPPAAALDWLQLCNGKWWNARIINFRMM